METLVGLDFLYNSNYFKNYPQSKNSFQFQMAEKSSTFIEFWH